ncbi:MAG: flagellar hook-length control protein FliK [Proteobacteria bacterium]|nr:flagellar hook-length control protein FliK [Pseudomonadota bacterium]
MKVKHMAALPAQQAPNRRMTADRAGSGRAFKLPLAHRMQEHAGAQPRTESEALSAAPSDERHPAEVVHDLAPRAAQAPKVGHADRVPTAKAAQARRTSQLGDGAPREVVAGPSRDRQQGPRQQGPRQLGPAHAGRPPLRQSPSASGPQVDRRDAGRASSFRFDQASNLFGAVPKAVGLAVGLSAGRARRAAGLLGVAAAAAPTTHERRPKTLPLVPPGAASNTETGAIGQTVSQAAPGPAPPEQAPQGPQPRHPAFEHSAQRFLPAATNPGVSHVQDSAFTLPAMGQGEAGAGLTPARTLAALEVRVLARSIVHAARDPKNAGSLRSGGATIELQHRQLGRVKIALRLTAGGLDLRFTVSKQSHGGMLRASAGQLRTRISQLGLNLRRMSVHTAATAASGLIDRVRRRSDLESEE